jgi:cation diffusion facilitator CzcD-associated flavoprotein CzcO/acetyl esterase/lipase
MTSVAIIGAGFGGVAAAVRLKQAGVTDLVLFERSDDVGGVWRANTYPGAACDVPSHLYSYSFAPKADWSRRFAPQSEIQQYVRDVAHDLGVLPHVRPRTEVLSAAFDEATARWRLELSDGTVHEADAVVAACGQLSRPARAAVPGLDAFRGALFHSAEWDHGHDLRGKRVAVLGTGASAIQFVPRIAPQTAALTVFQRSAPYVLPKRDHAYPRPVRALLSRVPGLLRASRWANYWNNEARTLGFNTEPRLLAGHALRFRWHLRRQVADPTLRAALTPGDPLGCKRVLISNDWYPALQLPQVELCTDRVVEVRERSVVTADGTEREVDTIVLGTGFTATELLVPMRVTGLGGRDLHDVWSRGARAYLGTAVPGFPSFFTLYGPNTNLGHNSILVMIEAQVGWVVQAVQQLQQGAAWVDVRPEAAQAFDDWVQERTRGTVFAGGCTSWYLTADGRNTQNWPASTLTFRRRLRRLRLGELVLQPAVEIPTQAGGAVHPEPGRCPPVPVVRAAVAVGSRPLGPRVSFPAQRRWLEAQARIGRVPAGTSIEQVLLGGRMAERVSAPDADSSRSVLLLHGGAFVTCSPRTHRVLAAHLARAAGVPVHVLDYRRAPEHPYPAAVDDAEAALEELLDDGPSAVVGDSAGGTLALLLALRRRDAGRPLPQSLGLISPLVDLTLVEAGGYTGRDVLLRHSWVRSGCDAFAGGRDLRSLSPLHLPLHGLPPVLVHLAEHERLRPEGERLVEALRAADVSVDLEVLSDLWHDVHLQADLVREGAAAVARMGRWLGGARVPV